jgi:hypothetical protein
MDESPNPAKNEEPGARLAIFHRPDEKMARRRTVRGDEWRWSKRRDVGKRVTELAAHLNNNIPSKKNLNNNKYWQSGVK